MFSTFLLIVSIVGRVMPYQYQDHDAQYQDYDAQYQDYDADWGYSLGDDWDVSNNIAARNPYYNTWKHLSAQMEQHAFAQHMGKIYRGQLANPEINFPRHRAFGLDSDFNSGDLAYESGAFEYKSKGQQQCGDYQLELSWTGAADKTAHYYLFMVPEKKKDGTLCSVSPKFKGQNIITSNYLEENYLEEENYLAELSEPGCGTVPGDDDSVDGEDFAGGKTTASTTHTLTTSAVSPDIPPITSSYHDYIYQIVMGQDPSHIHKHSAEYLEKLQATDPSAKKEDSGGVNPDEANPVLTVKYKGVQVSTIAVPPPAPGENVVGFKVYFFGCFVPQSNTCGGGYINQGGKGYYDPRSTSDFVAGALVLGDAGLCSASRKLE